MKKKFKLIILLSLIYLGNCSPSMQMLPQPVENKNLLIGSIIFDIDGYQDNFITALEKIEVAIVGRYVENGRLKNFGQWTTTDENGYFYITNVPDGEYAIKGFSAYIMGFGELKVINELNDPRRNYFELRNQDIINFGADLFDTRHNHRIVNFKHNIFTLYRNEVVESKRYDRLRDFKLSSGEIIDRLPAPSYFIEKYEGSGWEQYLSLP